MHLKLDRMVIISFIMAFKTVRHAIAWLAAINGLDHTSNNDGAMVPPESLFGTYRAIIMTMITIAITSKGFRQKYRVAAGAADVGAAAEPFGQNRCTGTSDANTG